MNIPADLIPGDILGFSGETVVRWKTAGLSGHVAIAIGGGKVITSLTATGVGIYDLAQNGTLVWVRRPVQPFNLTAALAWFKTVEGTPYGWVDIGAIADIKAISQIVEKLTGNKGMDCSHTVTLCATAGGCPQHSFDTRPASDVTPADFEISIGSTELWSLARPSPAV
jgi:hypothetical protein